ncbi:MAG: ABC transporter permease [Planctomycetota bacterium]|nr:ABC transporter permease [Planctomycetota bacterium]MDI6788184.1 ABC transporter permease [Planctomycetota bacterium]
MAVNTQIPFIEPLRMFLHRLGSCLIIIIETVRAYPYIGRRKRAILSEIERDIFGSLPVVMIMAIFTGMVLALQSGKELAHYGQEASIGILVSVSMCREMGPVMTAYILAGLIGSTIAAELGTMKVSEEIDALKVMSIDPINYLVLPRVVAMLIICPLLTIYTNIIGIAGGALIGNLELNIDFSSYFRNALDALTLKDIYSGLFKSLVFGFTIAIVGCLEGLNAENGAAGVGKATMKSVVISFVGILIFDFILTWLFY